MNATEADGDPISLSPSTTLASNACHKSYTSGQCYDVMNVLSTAEMWLFLNFASTTSVAFTGLGK